MKNNQSAKIIMKMKMKCNERSEINIENMKMKKIISNQWKKYRWKWKESKEMAYRKW